MRLKLPFGIAQVEKHFAMKLLQETLFLEPENLNKWKCNILLNLTRTINHHVEGAERLSFYSQLGIDKSNLRFKKHGADELAHYAKGLGH